MRISDWSSDVCSSDLGAVVCAQGSGIASVNSMDAKTPTGCFPQFAHDRSIFPSLDRLVKNNVVIPHHRPSLAVIYELLQLHRSHGAIRGQNVLGHVKDCRHTKFPSLVAV